MAAKADHPVIPHPALMVVHRAGEMRVRRISATRFIAAAAAAMRFQIGLGQGRALEALGIFLGDESGGDITRDEFRVIHHSRHERQVMADPLHLDHVSARGAFPRSPRRVSAPQVQSFAIIGS